MEMQRVEPSGSEPNDGMDEARRLRRLQVMMSMVMSVISQDPDLTVEEAAEMAASSFWGNPPPPILATNSLFSMVYGWGWSAKSSLQRGYC